MPLQQRASRYTGTCSEGTKAARAKAETYTLVKTEMTLSLLEELQSMSNL